MEHFNLRDSIRKYFGAGNYYKAIRMSKPMLKDVVVKGARQHNLKNIDVRIPRNKLTIITGMSGSGKSSLAFDTIYAEGQRRYVESLSAYARQFLGVMQKPDLDGIEGLSPAISIEQKTTSKNPRSLLVQPQKSTIIYGYSTRVSGPPIAQSVTKKLSRCPRKQ